MIVGIKRAGLGCIGSGRMVRRRNIMFCKRWEMGMWMGEWDVYRE